MSSLRDKMGFIFLAFFFLVSVSVVATSWTIETQVKDALVINLAGRQRMLLQAMTRHALEMEKHPDKLRHRELLSDAATTFERTLDALEHGGPAPYTSGQTVMLPPAQDPEVRARLEQVRQRWTTLRTEIVTLLASPRDDPALTRAVTAIEEQSPSLVADMDTAVQAFEQVATAKVQRLRWIQALFLGGAVILVILGYGLTYGTVIRPLQVLQRVASRIGAGELANPVPRLGRDEVGQLAQSLETMRQQLHAAHEDLEGQVAQRTRELEALYEVSREISSRLDIDHVLRSVTDKARDLLRGEVAFLCLMDDQGEALTLQASSGPQEALCGTRMPTENQPAALVLASREAVQCGVDDCAGMCGMIAPAFRASHLAAPLRVGEHVIGALCVGTSRARAFSDHEASLLTKLANSAAIALENARLYEQAERIATLEERQRIAAEMHDGLAQTLSLLGLKVDRATELVEAGCSTDAVNELQQVRAIIDQSSHEVRRSIADLQEEPLVPQSLHARLERMIKELTADEASPVELIADHGAPLLLPHGDMEQVVRVIQEALVNACRHARASKISIRLERWGNEATVVVEDDGCGFDPEAVARDGGGHFGLRIMRARAARIGGRVSIESAPGKGTRVVFTWPLNESPMPRGHAFAEEGKE